MEGAWYYQSALAIGERVAKGNITAYELTRNMLARIDELNGTLHCYRSVFAEQAINDAIRLDKELAQGQRRSLIHGVPVAVKDVFAIAGEVLGAGTSVLMRQPAQKNDAVVIERLRSAGAIILGSLSLTEGALASYHPSTVAPVNPWNQDRWSGVSSSGSGVAVSAGLCFAALGTDTGGSIRFPSAVNGVVGIKPSYGLVSTEGCFPLSPSMDHIGALTRTVADADLLLAIISGENTSLTKTPVNLEGVRIGIDKRFCCAETTPEIVTPILEALDIFVSAGADVIDISMPAWDKVEETWFPLCAAEALQVHSPWFPEQRDLYGVEFAQTLDRASTLPSGLIEQFKQYGREFTEAISEVFNRVELVFCPTFGIPVPPNVRDPEQEFPTMMRFTAPFDISGNPTLSIPCGFSKDGMPVSLQLVAGHLNEKKLMEAGMVYQARTNWHAYHPL